MTDEKKGVRKKDYTAILLLAVVAFAFVTIFLFTIKNGIEDRIQTSFEALRSELASEGLAAKQAKTSETFGSIFGECPAQGEYDSFVETDSRTMSVSNLQRALELHETACGQLFRERAELTLGFYEKDIATLRSYADLLSVGIVKKDAEEIVSYWEQIIALEREHAVLYGRMVDIQEAYWRAELNKVVKISTGNDREATVGALNYEASQKLDRIDLITKDLKSLHEEESLFWTKSFVDGA